MAIYKGSEGSYLTVEKLGAGGNGEVWRATGPHGDVALKLLKSGQRTRADAAPRFVREVDALRRLAGVPGVLPLLDADPDPVRCDRPWFAMPLATLLRERLGEEADLMAICTAVAELAHALAVIHERGVVHRDIKPDNLYWYQNSWCLGDFGLADFQDAEPLTRSDRKLGPAYYIAPEMLNTPRVADGRAADVYSLGKTLWVLLSGQTYPLPGVHDPTFAGAAIASYRREPGSSSLDELLRRMTLIDAGQRPSAVDVAKELDVLSKDKTMNEPPSPAASLDRLRKALAPHFTREQELSRQQAVAQGVVGRIRQAVEEIAGTIHEQTGLPSQRWYDFPQFWSQFEMSSSVEWEEQEAFAFEAGGGDVVWRLVIALMCQLLDDGRLFIQTAYYYDVLVCGHNANSSSNPDGWEYRNSAMNGTPSCEAMADVAVAGLWDNLPAAVDQFAELVQDAPR